MLKSCWEIKKHACKEAVLRVSSPAFKIFGRGVEWFMVFSCLGEEGGDVGPEVTLFAPPPPSYIYAVVIVVLLCCCLQIKKKGSV